MQNPFSTLSNKVKSAIREKAISRAKTRIVLAQKSPDDFSAEELEVIVQEEEAQIYANIREKGLLAVLAVLGLNFFG
ncbi:hypothetical protein ACOI22_00165 [Glaciecola sp. 2405UD65-10]|jgi:hypothetical protein|uniref:hypothetical protein n=1 Tax=Glaciecola sp. 2405UD65-10 TaxID=3397244 RepID=UPI003B5AFDA8